ncbi:DUF434 domain-containing protein [Pyrococcus abyssi]|uniref:DUF434 domain-containing protein n=1 Tax=Pyrococcus abyssi (strain GE5 / Orsay) TaxID=272844 RepID=Q9V1J4_PYRAB|nr:DUF434 domain-containing protein [Pyrococcus abyssi]CAB49355.1 Hypothetical protein PAB2059 [Pyrococcus abyssi GE5]CCE69814.1 TPA: hypothetical protein PAB2059 [Pyrococcus abyssi GE5]
MARLKEAYMDLKFLLNRGYRKKVALNFVCNHYRLPSLYRHFLARCVFSDYWILEVREKASSCKGEVLGVDGFNVLITIESLMNGEAIRCEDWIIRDLKYQGKYRISEKTEESIRLMLLAIKEVEPREVVIFYGASNPRSALVKRLTEESMRKLEIDGEVKLVKSPDFELKNFEYVATGDVGIIEKAKHVVDLPSYASILIKQNPMEFKEMLNILDERLK